MSFRCTRCGLAQEDRTKPKRRVLEVRKVVYFRNGNPDDPIGEGTEIVREGVFCEMCAEKFDAGQG